MTSIQSDQCIVHFNTKAYEALNEHLSSSDYSKVFLIVDTNTHQLCSTHFLERVKTDLEIEIIEIPEGELNKTIDICVQVWQTLSELGADRSSLVINLGGGVVTDLGGFVACTYMRGISYINVPTSLLAMVDASVGGKTGVDLGTLKNQIGVISEGEMVLVDTAFLQTLPQDQLRSGLAEMLKHGLIHDRVYWNTMSDLSQLTLSDLDQLIHESIQIKNTIVTSDPYEKGLRKTLNYGHTLGHAIESYCLSSEEKEDLLHGEAIAIGMVLESYISSKLLGFSIDDLDHIKQVINHTYKHIDFNANDIASIIELLKHDKKNKNGIIRFVLLEAIGTPKINCEVPNALIHEAFEYYTAK